MLINQIKKELLEKIEEVEIDVTELDSYAWDRNPYGIEEQLIGTSASGDWDEQEEWIAKVEKLIQLIQADNSIAEYCNITEDEDNESLTHEAIIWLTSLIESN